MVFASPIFIFLFLPVVLLAYFATPRLARNVILLFFSLMFYAWGEFHYLFLILISILFNWILGLAIAGVRSDWGRKAWLCVGITGNVLALGYFKYINFFVDNTNQLLKAFGSSLSLSIPEVLLPLGISFFTFHAISYLVDIYRGSASVERSPVNFSVYILLFPQLIAGPIIRWKHIYWQFRERQETFADFRWGVSRFIIGLAKKTLIANPVGIVADTIFALPPDQLSPSAAWLGLLCYTLQIYFDFSGYSDMAIGLMRMFGFHILENFNYPYISRSVREFWRRWHISLSTFFRDYVYIPLGGNQASRSRIYFNTMVVFLLSGLWHGASWTFILWGMWHGLFICLEIAFLAKLLERMGPLAHVYGLLAIMGGWVLFRSHSLEQALNYYEVLAGISRPSAINGSYFLDNQVIITICIGILGSTPIIKVLKLAFEQVASPTGLRLVFADIPRISALAGLFLLSIATLAGSSYNPFIYFRF